MPSNSFNFCSNSSAFLSCLRPWWPSDCGTGGFHIQNPIPLKIRRVCVTGAIRRHGSKVLPLVWCESLERREVPSQVLSSSSYSGSKLRGMSQLSPRCLKTGELLELNQTKLNFFSS
ncbi:hypothetical protein AVEN_38732-1 [Araneus ventricosus]|uniref:Uncharacterized protein n=1 Tax=Araneus ventricosus TaxID=182803 RepID=A0A4Y2QL48_ARAVE|nr:hypothetical protein AVEN_38732-1 [Araneus ventricosus]